MYFEFCSFLFNTRATLCVIYLVRMMAATCVEAESIINYDQSDSQIRRHVLAAFGNMSPAESIASSAAKTCWYLCVYLTLMC